MTLYITRYTLLYKQEYAAADTDNGAYCCYADAPTFEAAAPSVKADEEEDDGY